MNYFFDYISASKVIPQSEINFATCEKKGYLSWGLHMLQLSNKSPITVNYNNLNSTLNFSGSIPHFVKGHNLFSCHSDYVQGIGDISDNLKLDLSDAMVKGIELGTVLEVNDNKVNYFEKHIALNGYYKQSYDHGIRFVKKGNRNISFKMYDALRRNLQLNPALIKKLIRLGIIKQDKRYLRFEIHLATSKTITSVFGRDIYVCDTLSEDFYEEFSRIIPIAYNEIIKTKEVNYNFSKLSSKPFTNFMRSMLVYESKIGESLTDIYYKFLKGMPDEIMSDQNRNNHKKPFQKCYTEALKLSLSEFDLSKKFFDPPWFSPYVQN